MAELPPRLQALRQTHTLACLAHFLYTFRPALKLDQYSFSDVEHDLAGSGTNVLPYLVARLLVIMTHDRKITHENFEAYLRRQFTRRVPYKPNPLGHEDEPTHWPDVDFLLKLDMLFHLCEWQFTGAGRLRTMMGEVDDLEWRLEPIGQDAKKNTYWHIGGDRLWVQHPNPNPPPPPSRKRRRPPVTLTKPSTTANNKSKSRAQAVSKRGGARKPAPRGRAAAAKGKKSSAAATNGNGNGATRSRRAAPRSPSPAPEDLITATRTRSGGRSRAQPVSTRPMRSAAVAANANLRKRPAPADYFEDDVAIDEPPDKDAHPSPVPQRLTATRSSKRARTTASATPASPAPTPAAAAGTPRSTRATRNSSRVTRGRNGGEGDEDEWQQIPDEWLRSDSVSVPPHASSEHGDATGKDAENGTKKSANQKSGSGRRILNPRRIVSPGSSPGPASTSTPAAAIFGDDDSDLTDLSDDDDDDKPAAEKSKSKSKAKAVVENGDATADDKDQDDASDIEKNAHPTADADPVTDADPITDGEGEDDKEEADEEEEDEEEYDDEDDMDVDEEYAIRIAYATPKDWIEWETACVTLEEWQEFPKQFEGSTSMKERALYKVLVPIAESVIESFKEAIRESQKEVAVSARKRSSRLLVIEKQHEAEEAEKRRKLEEAESKSREARHAKREQTRAERAAEREERIRAKEIEAALEQQREEEARLAALRPPPPPPPATEEYGPSGRPARAAAHRAAAGMHNAAHGSPPNGAGSGTTKRKHTASRSHARNQDWELDCEVCGKVSVNPKDTGEITCCEICGKWQHVDCHNRVDAAAGRPIRNWEVVHFMCEDCDRAPSSSSRRGGGGASSSSRQRTSGRPQRINQDGRPSGTPGPQPAQRSVPKTRHVIPVPLPLSPAPGASGGGYGHAGYPTVGPTGGWPQQQGMPQHYQQPQHVPMHHTPQHAQYARPARMNGQYPSPTAQRPGEYAPLQLSPPQAGRYPHPQSHPQYANQQPQVQVPAGYPQPSYQGQGQGYPPPPQQQPYYHDQQPSSSSTQIQYNAAPAPGYNNGVPPPPPAPLNMGQVQYGAAPTPGPGRYISPQMQVQVQQQAYGASNGIIPAHHQYPRGPAPAPPPISPIAISPIHDTGYQQSPLPQPQRSNSNPWSSPVASSPQQQQQFHPSYTNGHNHNPVDYIPQNGQQNPSPVALHSPYGSYPSPSPGGFPPIPAPQMYQRPLSAAGHQHQHQHQHSASPSIPAHVTQDVMHHSHSHSPRSSNGAPSPTSLSNGTYHTTANNTINSNHLPQLTDPILYPPLTSDDMPARTNAAWRAAHPIPAVHVAAQHSASDVISPLIPPEPPAPRARRTPSQRAPRPPVGPLGPDQHFAGSFRARPPPVAIGGSGGGEASGSGSGEMDPSAFPGANMNVGRGGGRNGDKQQLYQPPPTKPRGVSSSSSSNQATSNGGLDTLSEAAQMVHSSTSNSG